MSPSETRPRRITDLRSATPLAVFFVALLVVMLGLIELGVLEYTYTRLGIGHRMFTGLLLLSLLGSIVNVPLTSLRTSDVAAHQTIIAVNLGGAVVPILLSLYLLFVHHLYVQGAVAIALVATVSHVLARPVPGVGIAVPIFLPPVAAALTSLLLAPNAPAALAYAAGSLGTLIGADLANLGRIRELRAAVVSIGGAGTFDGVFLTGILAVLLA